MSFYASFKRLNKLKNRAEIKKEWEAYVDGNLEKSGHLARQSAIEMFDFIDETVINYGVYLNANHEQVIACKDKSIKELRLHVKKLEKKLTLCNEKLRLRGTK